MGLPLRPEEPLCLTLYALTDLDHRCPRTRAEKWRRWARAIRRHQRRLMARLLAEINGEVPAMPELPGRPLPWTVEDLAGYRKHDCYDFTSPYFGVSRTRAGAHRHGWIAYRPGSHRYGRKRLGFFATELEAAQAVLLALNPNATIPLTPTEIPHD